MLTETSDAGSSPHVAKRGFFNDVPRQNNAINIINQRTNFLQGIYFNLQVIKVLTLTQVLNYARETRITL